jgi:hypothetical protein
VNDNSSRFTGEMYKLHLHGNHLIDCNQFHGIMHLDLLELLFRERVRAGGVNKLLA